MKTAEPTPESSDLEGQMRDRMASRDRLSDKGIHPYANDFRVAHSIAELPDDVESLPPEDGIAADAPRYQLAGRMIQVNDMGKARFLFLRGDGGAMVQLYLRADNADAFALASELHLGDIVGVSGALFRTKKGKRSLKVETLRILTKALRPLPGKVLQTELDVSDLGLLYRQRYLDFILHPEKADQVFRKRARILREMRQFFDERGYVECETRMLLSNNGGAAARPFVTRHNALDMELQLRIATELDLKRLVVGGMDRVYEIGRIFRNEGMDRFHNPEFTSIEFYQAYATYEDLMVLTEALFERLALAVCGRAELTYQGTPVSFKAPFRRMTMLESVLAVKPDWPVEKQSGQALVDAFEAYVENTLIQPTFITQFPIEVSPLSRKNEKDPRFVDRFELIVLGKELANAFSELNDPADQRKRFADQVVAKAAGDEEAMDYDEDFCRALEFGMPPTAGEGIGIDRLVMFLCDQPSIRDVILFPQMRPEEP